MNPDNPTNQYGQLKSSDMLDKSGRQDNHSIRMIFITILVIFVSIGGYIILSNPELKARTKEALKLAPKNIEQNTVDRRQSLKFVESKISDRQLPWIEVKPESDKFSVGKESTIYITGNSSGKDITGYDLLIGIDKSYFDIVSIESQIEGFNIFHFDRELYQSITGIKAPEDKETTPFADTKIVKVVVLPKMKGESLITVLGSKDQEKTQFVDSDVNVISPQIGSYLVTIQ